MCVIWGMKGENMDGLKGYRDQIQERIDRLEKMEPVFEAMREALDKARIWAIHASTGGKVNWVEINSQLATVKALADKVSRGK